MWASAERPSPSCAQGAGLDGCGPGSGVGGGRMPRVHPGPLCRAVGAGLLHPPQPHCCRSAGRSPTAGSLKLSLCFQPFCLTGAAVPGGQNHTVVSPLRGRGTAVSARPGQVAHLFCRGDCLPGRGQRREGTGPRSPSVSPSSALTHSSEDRPGSSLTCSRLREEAVCCRGDVSMSFQSRLPPVPCPRGCMRAICSPLTAGL